MTVFERDLSRSVLSPKQGRVWVWTEPCRMIGVHNNANAGKEIQTHGAQWYRTRTVFLKLVSRHEFEREAVRHHRGRKLRSMSRWSQFVAMATAQLSGRCSLRDIVSNLDAQAAKLYHLGVRRVARTSLARVNEKQPFALYEALFGRLLARCCTTAPGHGFRFHNKLFSLDATYVDLCLELFPWAQYRKTKGALKLHVGLDHEGFLPAFLQVTDGKGSDVEVARSLRLPKGSIVAADRLYLDFEWLRTLDAQGVFLVTRLKRRIKYAVRERRSFAPGSGVTSDQTIELTSVRGRARCPVPPLREVHAVLHERRRGSVFQVPRQPLPALSALPIPTRPEALHAARGCGAPRSPAVGQLPGALLTRLRSRRTSNSNPSEAGVGAIQ